jgi:hypothetical protein
MRALLPGERQRLWAAGLILLAIAAGLAAQWPGRGLWYDETVNAYFAGQPWSALWEWCTQVDNQVPLHFALLKLWAGAGGTSEFALRAVSFWSALLAAAGLLALGRRMGGATAGALAAGAFALTQSFAYAAFEVRPYGLALALAAWSSVVLWEVWRRCGAMSHRDRRCPGLFLAYWLLAVGLLYTHYTGALILAVHGAAVGWRVWRVPSRRRVAMAALLAAGVAAGYLPWAIALAGRDVRAGTAFADRITPAESFDAYLTFYAHGQRAVPPDAPPYGWAMVAVIAGAGALWLALRRIHRRPIHTLALPLLATLLPLAALIVMVYGVQAKLSGRHGWVAWLGAALIVGVGLAALRRARWPVWAGALLVLWLPATASYPPTYHSYLREAFAYLRQHAAPGDVLLLRDGTLFTAAGYYDAALPWTGLPPDKLTDVNRFLFFDEAITALDALIDANGAQRVWVLAWQGDIMDPQNLVGGMLEYLGEPEPLPGAFGFGDVSLARYRLLRDPADLRARVHALQPVVQAPPDGPLYLGGYVLGADTVPRGGVVHLHTWWQRGATVMPEVRASVRLYASDRHFHAQLDQPPAGPSFGQENWAAGQPVLGRYALSVPLDMLPGAAEVRLILYDMQGAFAPVEVVVDRLTIGE